MGTKDIKIVKYVILIILVFLAVFTFKNCQPEPQFNAQEFEQKENKIQISELHLKNDFLAKKIAKQELIIDSLERSKVIAKGNYTKLKETRPIAPIYVPDVISCNDTIQALYKWSLKKDSVCESVVSDAENIIYSQDSVIGFSNHQIQNLKTEVDIKDRLNTDLKQSVNKEKVKKNIWKSATIGAIVIIGKLVLFK